MKLPEAVELEAAILGAILFDGEIMADVLEILPHAEMFANEKHRLIYGTMMRLYGGNAPVSLETVAADLQQRNLIEAIGRVYLVELLEKTATAAHAVYHAGIIAQKYTERELYLTARRVQQRIEQGETDDIRSWATEAIYEAGRVDPPTPPLWQQVEEALRLNEQGIKDGTIGYSWALPRLDRFSGGLRAGKTTVLAALKKAGKTKFVVRAIAELLQVNIPVLFFSLEMRATAVLNWIASYREQIDSGRFETDRLAGEELERTSRCLAALADQNRLVIFDRSFPTLEQIRQEVRREVQRRGVKVVVLDFIQRVNVEQQKGESRAGALQRLAYRLADLARDYNVALLLVAQFSNEAEKTTSLHMGLIKESGGIAEAADVILFLDNKRRTQHKTSCDPVGQTEFELIVEGQRNGVSGIRIPLIADLRFGHFTEQPTANTRRDTVGVKGALACCR